MERMASRFGRVRGWEVVEFSGERGGGRRLLKVTMLLGFTSLGRKVMDDLEACQSLFGERPRGLGLEAFLYL